MSQGVKHYDKVIGYLATTREATAKQIAAYIGSSVGAMCGTLKDMEEKDLIARRKSKLKWAVFVYALPSTKTVQTTGFLRKKDNQPGPVISSFSDPLLAEYRDKLNATLGNTVASPEVKETAPQAPTDTRPDPREVPPPADPTFENLLISKIEEYGYIAGRSFGAGIRVELTPLLDKFIAALSQPKGGQDKTRTPDTTVEELFHGTATKRESLAKPALPKVLVVGLLNGQTQHIRTDFNECFNLSFVNADQNLHHLTAQARYSDAVFVMANFISHTHVAAMKSDRGPKPILVYGGLTTLSEAMTTYYVNSSEGKKA